ncbi:MAG: arsenite methyltransferase [Proteobacteria bacterium]|nr:arsenite methyltransferase [Pseudomonadota bacterium]MBU1737755.1 arsenite methyltransferase [Pseudomonadota bacterium]
MKNVASIRDSVAKAYAKAIGKAAPSCCGISACCGTKPRQGEPHATMAGYGQAEVHSHPEAAATSFGCGNPLAFSGVKKGDTVLDLGSGAGFDLLIAGEKVGPKGRVIGIDMTDEMIARARKNITKAGARNIEIRKGIIEEMPVAANSVDWVISNCVINLSPEKDKVFTEIHRVLKPGGRMLVSDIVVSELPPKLRELESLYNSCVAGAISEEEYISGLARAGLVDIKVTERMVYEADQIRPIFAADQAPLSELSAALSPAEAETLINQSAGKVWSAKFSAGKPA